MNCFKLFVLGVFVFSLSSIWPKTNASVDTNELSAIMLYAQELHKMGYSKQQIIEQCTRQLTNNSTEQGEPVLTKKTNNTLVYIGVAIVATVTVGALCYWLFFLSQKEQNNQAQKNAQNQTNGTGQQHNNNVFQALIQGVQFNVVGGNIEQQHFAHDETAAIVNAANEALQGGGGVDAAVHAAAGAAQLQQFCRDNFVVNRQGNRCNPGQAVITPGFNLAPRRIIHTVAPRANFDPQWQQTLAQAYQNCMRVADENNLTAVAFPALGTGIFGCDPHVSAGIAVQTANHYLTAHPESHLNEIRFVCWGQNQHSYRNELARLARS